MNTITSRSNNLNASYSYYTAQAVSFRWTVLTKPRNFPFEFEPCTLYRQSRTNFAKQRSVWNHQHQIYYKFVYLLRIIGPRQHPDYAHISCYLQKQWIKCFLVPPLWGSVSCLSAYISETCSDTNKSHVFLKLTLFSSVTLWRGCGGSLNNYYGKLWKSLESGSHRWEVYTIIG
jgi:hypothetical protein